MSSNREKANKKIVVTGATGMVGSYLVAELLRQGYSRITLPVRDRKRMSVLHRTLSREKIDVSKAVFNVGVTTLNNPHRLNDLFKDADMVFNCAARVAIGGVDEQELIQTNVEIAQHIVDASLRCGVKKLIHVSSVSALGKPQEPERCADEDSVMETLSEASAYGKSKFLSEHEITRGSYLGLDTVIVNPATILGGGNWGSGSGMIIPILSKGLKIYTEGVTAWVDVRDVAKAMVMLSERDDVRAERFVLSAENISYRELITMFNSAVGKRPPTINIGTRMVSAASKMEGVISRLRARDQKMTDDIAEIILQKNCFDGSRITERFGFEYTPMEETVKRVVKEYLEKKNG